MVMDNRLLGLNLKQLTLRELQGRCAHKKVRYFCPCQSDCKSFELCEKCSKVFCDNGCYGKPSEEVRLIRQKEADIKAEWKRLRELDGLQNLEEYRPEWFYDKKKIPNDQFGFVNNLIEDALSEINVPVVAKTAEITQGKKIANSVNVQSEDVVDKGASKESGDRSKTAEKDEKCTDIAKNLALRFVPTSVTRASQKTDEASSIARRKKVCLLSQAKDVPLSPQWAKDVPISPQWAKDVPISPQRAKDVPTLPQWVKDVPISPQRAKDVPISPQRAKDIRISPQRTAIEEFLGLQPKPLDTRDSKTVYSLTALNESGQVNVVPLNDQKYLEMLDDCMDADDLNCLTEIPEIGTYVMSKFNEGNQFYRAKVEDIEGDKVMLSFLDLGTSKLVDYTQLKPIVEEAFTKPIFGYQGCLTKAADNQLLIIPDILNSFRSEKIGRNFNLKQETWNGAGREFVLIDVRTGQSLADEFNEMKVWMWERNLRKCGSGIDVDLIEKGNWHGMDSSLDSIQVLPIPIGKEIEAKYVQDSEQGAVFVVPVSLKSYCGNMVCLNAQMRRYCEQVKVAQYYPTLSDVFIYYDGGSYHRCRRLSESLIQSLDNGDMYPLPNVDETVKFVRRITPDFLQVPIGIIECNVTGGGDVSKMVSLERRELRVRIGSFNEDKLIYNITILGVV